MFALVPLVLEIFFVLLKPQELYPWLQAFQPLYTLPALILLGFVFDTGRFALGAGRISEAPYVRVTAAFFVWSMLTVAYYAPSRLSAEGIQLGTSLILAFAIAHAAQTTGKFAVVVGVLLLLTLFLAFVGDHQHLAPTRCYWVDPLDGQIFHYDGRPCETADICKVSYEDERRFVCEHPGLMQTSTVYGRIRFRGNLEDPNELALTTGIGVPLAFALFQRKKSFLRGVLVVATLGLVGACMVFSQSRGGQLVLLVVLGTYFIRRFGLNKGLIVAVVAAIPVLALGGRSTEEAEGSSIERTECLQVGLSFVRASPLFGVGKGQFGEHHYLTAHNSYVLAAAELGLVGFMLWSLALYLAIKIPVSALRELRNRPGEEAEAARIWGTAVLASMAGLAVGSFFLSFTYHPIFWIYVGFSGAYAARVRRAIPSWRVRLTFSELMGLAVANVALLVAIFGYTKYKLG
jgi:hypothetical protein